MLKVIKKWRELPLEERTKKIIEVFQIPEKIINLIRKIENKKEKLIAAAKIQHQMFGEIHSYLTCWIAGYGSDVEVRHVFGSTNSLRSLFIKPLRCVKGIEYSWQDIKREIKIPEKMNSLLAEETGIHLGDGCLFLYVDARGYMSYRYSITGHIIDEELYHINHIAKLLHNIYNLKHTFIRRPTQNTIDTLIGSKAIFQFKSKILGLPLGSKKNANIPKIILENNEFSKRCLVGLFDTDFNVTEHLAISGKLHSLNLTKQIHEILLRNNIKHIYKEYSDYGRFYIGKDFAKIIVKEWRMHNPKHLTKFEVFEKFGKFIPFTTTPERISLLNGNLSLEDLDKLSVQRRKTNDSARTRTSDPSVSSNSFL